VNQVSAAYFLYTKNIIIKKRTKFPCTKEILIILFKHDQNQFFKKNRIAKSPEHLPKQL